MDSQAGRVAYCTACTAKILGRKRIGNMKRLNGHKTGKLEPHEQRRLL